jgi:hypothetical protein
LVSSSKVATTVSSWGFVPVLAFSPPKDGLRHA